MSIFDAFSRFAIETTRHYMRKILTPDVPPVGQLALYFKSDGILYQLDENGIETPVGSSILHDPVTVPHGGTSVDTFGPHPNGAIIHTPGPLGQEDLYAGPLTDGDLEGNYEFPGDVLIDGNLQVDGTFSDSITSFGPFTAYHLTANSSIIFGEVASDGVSIGLITTGTTMPFPGHVVGLSVNMNVGPTIGSAVVQLLKTGTPGTLNVTITNETSTHTSITQESGDDFDAGENIGVSVTADNSWDPGSPGFTDITVFILVKFIG